MHIITGEIRKEPRIKETGNGKLEEALKILQKEGD